MKVAEYWIVDVENILILAFAIANGSSRRISESQVLPGLKVSVLAEALRRTRQMDQAQVGALLLSNFSNSYLNLLLRERSHNQRFMILNL